MKRKQQKQHIKIGKETLYTNNALTFEFLLPTQSFQIYETASYLSLSLLEADFSLKVSIKLFDS